MKSPITLLIVIALAAAFFYLRAPQAPNVQSGLPDISAQKQARIDARPDPVKAAQEESGESDAKRRAANAALLK
jgi:hypothetical protein